MGENILNCSTGNILGTIQNQQNSKKPRRMRNNTVEKMNYQECAVYPMNRVKMHL